MYTAHVLNTAYCHIYDSNEKAPILSIKITDKEKKKYILYNPIKSVESYIDTLFSYDSLLEKRRNLIGTFPMETEIV